MENNENLVAENVAENTEAVTAEETAVEAPKVYTEEELNARVNEILGKKIARKEAKIRKEVDREYGELVEVLKAGTGKESVGEIRDAFKEFYQKKGVTIPAKSELSAQDIKTLANAEADEIIRGGFDEVVEEADRLNELGAANMTAKEKAVFKLLTDHIQNAERGNELAKIGVTKEVYDSKEFKDFASKFAASTPIRDVYDIYTKTQPKKEYKTMGSMKNTASADSGIKDFYTPEEARRFTQKDFEKNPKLFERVVESSHKWGK
ncbi:MAG: hypothetical protein IKY44_01995 [Clostridia bacterium]|nr:hypothetical protein [Clostridia bacterium]